MNSLIILTAGLFILFYILKYDASWARYRVELFFAMFGVDYKPSKIACFIVATLGFLLIYGVIYNR